MVGEDRNKNEWRVMNRDGERKQEIRVKERLERFRVVALDFRLQSSGLLLMCSVTFHQPFNFPAVEGKHIRGT